MLENYEIIELSFINKLKPYKITYNEGLPLFKPHGWSDLFDLNNNEVIHLSIKNEGGKSQGLMVEITGVDTNLIDFQSVEISQRKSIRYADGSSRAEVINVHNAVFNSHEQNNCIAVFSDIEIAPGINITRFTEVQKQKGISHKKVREEIYEFENKCTYFIKIKAFASNIVTSNIEMRITPIENPKGYINYTFIVSNDPSFIDAYYSSILDSLMHPNEND